MSFTREARFCAALRGGPCAWREVSRTQRRAVVKRARSNGPVAQIGGWELGVQAGCVNFSTETYRLHRLEQSRAAPTLDAVLACYEAESRALLAAAIERGLAHAEPWDLELLLASAPRREVRVTGRASAIDDERRRGKRSASGPAGPARGSGHRLPCVLESRNGSCDRCQRLGLEAALGCALADTIHGALHPGAA